MRTRAGASLGLIGKLGSGLVGRMPGRVYDIRRVA